eukprot:1014795_1
MRSLLDETNADHGYTSSQLNTIVTLTVTVSSMSLIASLFIIINYWAIRPLRQQLAYKLTLWIGVSDLIHVISFCMGAPLNHGVCILQGITMQFGSVSSIGWVLAVSWTIHHLMTAKRITRGGLKRKLYFMHIIIWSVTILFTVLPLFTDTYGASGGWCWFANDKAIDTVWRYLLFYVPLWLGIVYMIYIYVVTWKMIKIVSDPEDNINEDDSNISGLDVESIDDANKSNLETAVVPSESQTQLPKEETSEIEKEKKKKSKALKRMVLFPLILIIGYFFATIRRIVDAISGRAPFWLAVFQIFMMSLIPFFDAVVYGMTKDVRKRDKEFIKKHCGCCFRDEKN